MLAELNKKQPYLDQINRNMFPHKNVDRAFFTQQLKIYNLSSHDFGPNLPQNVVSNGVGINLFSLVINGVYGVTMTKCFAYNWTLPNHLRAMTITLHSEHSRS